MQVRKSVSDKMTKHRINAFVAVQAAFLLFCALCVVTCGDTETEALLNWKQSLPKQQILDSWVLSSSSSNNSSPCSWRGITCDNSSRSVISINLASTGLRGTLQNLNFSAFPNLLRLDLKLNNLYGTIPERIGVLSKLQFLDLSTNQLNGTLPLSLANLTQVYELDVSRNKISGILDPRLFPDGSDQPKTGLIEIRSLLFQNTLLGGRIPDEIGNLRNLSYLALDSNSFNGSIPASLGNCTHLGFLSMSENQLSGMIPPSIGRLTNLSDVRLYINNLSGPVPQELGNFSSLTVLHLAQNNFTGQLPPQVCKGGNLVNFSAAYNSFTGPIPVSLRNCSSLYRVRMQYNQLTGLADQDFGVYPNLTYIDFSYNKVKGYFSSNWGRSKNLQYLGMAGNSIDGTIPGEIFQLNQLVELHASSNQLSGEIPPQIGNSSSLSILSLGSNKLSGFIPQSIGKLLNLQTLDLSANKLRGPIPDQIGGFSKLLSLNLSKNDLNGTIPSQIGNLASLQNFLDLSFNSFSGGIPANLGKLTSLISLNLSHNNLSGSIPNSIGGMLSLSRLNLSYNNLLGRVPDSGIFNSSGLVDVSHNKDLCGNIQGLQPCKVSVNESEAGHSKKKVIIAIVASLGGALLVLLAIIGILLFGYKRKTKALKKNSASKREAAFSMWYFNSRISYGDIIEATNNFDDTYLIGEGALGKVYRMEMQGGQVFAIKKLKSEADSLELETMKAFKSEIEAMTETRHRNIVKLYGFYTDISHTFLVYEYMERGSLSDMLRNDNEALELDWSNRVGIIKGVAQALSYMHHDCKPSIVHRDISSKNVLLSTDLEAHVSDFGTARFLKSNSNIWTSFAGTYGYAAPELAYTRAVSEKCDVYSFGVLVLEIIMGKHPGDLISHIQTSSVQNMNFRDILDPRMSAPENKQNMKALTLIGNLALSCLQTNPTSRPTMLSIAQMIEKDTDHDSGC